MCGDIVAEHTGCEEDGAATHEHAVNAGAHARHAAYSCLPRFHCEVESTPPFRSMVIAVESRCRKNDVEGAKRGTSLTFDDRKEPQMLLKV